MFSSDILLQLGWTGLATSSFYMLFATAFALVLKVNQVWNFGQAGLMVIGYFSCYIFLQILDFFPLWAIVFSIFVTILAGCCLEKYGFGVLRERKSPPLTFFIFSIVIAQFFVFFAELIFGTTPKTLYPSLNSKINLFYGIVITNWDLFALISSIIIMSVLYFIMKKTKLGYSMTAVSDNPELAEMYGIKKEHIYLYSISISSFLLFWGMYLFGTKAAIFPSTPLLQLLVFAVIATIIAGIGNVFGAAMAAIFLSLLQAFSILLIPSKWQILIAYGLIFFIILFFPKGFVLNLSLFKTKKNMGS